MADEPHVRIEVTLPAPVDVVWRWLRDPVEIRRWHGWEDEGLDDEIRLIFGPDAVADEVAGTLHMGGHLFTLVPDGPDTVVRVTRATPIGSDLDWDAFYDEVDEGWLTFLQQLRFALARHPDDDRRTLFLSGEIRAATPTPPAEVLGLDGVEGVAVGQRYGVDAASGEHLAGEVWFRSELQLGLTVDGWGDGLLVVAAGPSGPAPGATAMAVLTTYGLDDDTLDALSQRWTTWWGTRYRVPGRG